MHVFGCIYLFVFTRVVYDTKLNVVEIKICTFASNGTAE